MHSAAAHYRWKKNNDNICTMIWSQQVPWLFVVLSYLEAQSAHFSRSNHLKTISHNLTRSNHLKGYFSQFYSGGACPRTSLALLGYQLTAPLLQINLGETLSIMSNNINPTCVWRAPTVSSPPWGDSLQEQCEVLRVHLRTSLIH